jgi:hypothetical protein
MLDVSQLALFHVLHNGVQGILSRDLRLTGGEECT